MSDDLVKKVAAAIRPTLWDSEDAARAAIEVMEKNPKTCNWTRDCTEDGDCHWETACGTGWCTTWNTPAEDNYNFCPSCGGKVAHVRNDLTKEN